MVPPPVKKVSVLRFENLSNESANRYFSDGISEEILNLLVRAKNLSVVSRSSSFRIDPISVDAREVREILSATHVVTGSVRRHAGRVRIVAELSDTANNQTIWSEVYERQLTDVFVVQSEIARAISTELSATLEAPISEEVSVSGYDQYLRALEIFRRADMPSVVKLLEGLSDDQHFAQSLSLLGRAHFNLMFSSSHSTEQATQTAMQYAKRALAIDPNDPQARFTLAACQLFATWDVEEHLRLLDTLDGEFPSFPFGVRRFVEWRLGNPEAAMAMNDRLISLDPLSAEFRKFRADMLNMLGRLPEAIEAMQNVRTLVPDNGNVNGALAVMYFNSGESDRVHEYLARASSEKRGELQLNQLLAGGHHKKFEELIDDAFRHRSPTLYTVYLYALALAFDKAFLTWERVVAARHWSTLVTRQHLLHYNPPFPEEFLEDKRLSVLLEKVGASETVLDDYRQHH